MAIENDIIEKINRKLVFYPAPPALELEREILEFLDKYEGYGRKMNRKTVISHLRHNYSSWPKLQERLQEWRVWSVSEHHEIRDYVDELICLKFEDSIPLGIG